MDPLDISAQGPPTKVFWPLELDDISISKRDRNYNPWCRVVRMFQDQACNLSEEEQADYGWCADDLAYYALTPLSVNDPKQHEMCKIYLDAVPPRGPMPRARWLILEALYEDEDLVQLAALPGIGPRPEIRASRYAEY